MTEFFLKTVNMSISTSWLVLAVLVLRLVLKRAPKWANILLWGVVALRLMCPFSIESALSLIPSAETIPIKIEMDTSPAINSGVDSINDIVNPIISRSNTPAAGASANPLQITLPVLSIIWLLGMIALVIYTLVSYWRLRRMVDTAVLLRENIFQSEYVGSPFVLGLVRPRIYLPIRMEAQDMAHVIAHEQAHIHRKDHWWKPLGFLLLTVHWFNPLLWVSYVLLCRDIELACDERVIRNLGSEQRADYTQALVSCSIRRSVIAACPLAFGEVSVKERVKSVMQYKKPAFRVTVIALAVCIAVAVCFLTDPVIPSLEVLPEVHSHSYGVVEVTYESNYAGRTMTAQENTPVYSITEDYQLRIKDPSVSYTDWVSLGCLTETSLTKDNFDDIFYFEDGWADGESAFPIRRDAAKVWELVLLDQDAFFRLIQMKNGELFLADGYYDTSEKNDPGSDDTAVRWLYRLAVDLNEEYNIMAKSGDNAVPVSIFPAGTVIGNYSRTVHRLTIDPGEDTVPFRVYRDGEEIRGHYVVFDAETYEPLSYTVPYGLEPQTYLFQNADPEREYIVVMQSVEADSPICCFGVRFEDSKRSFHEMLTDLKPMLMVNGQIYLDTGEAVPVEIDPSAILGKIGSSVTGDQQPTEEGQSNFGCVGSDYARLEDGVVVLIDHEWYYFEPEMDGDIRYVLTIGTEGVYSIEISGPNSSGGFTKADGAPFRMGDQVWLEPMDGWTDLSGVTITARGAEGSDLFSVRISDYYDPEEPEEPIVCGDWIITPQR